MRVACIQGGVGVEPVEAQAARLLGLTPESYFIEATPTAQAWQRTLERLERLTAGDELCLASLEALRGEALQLLRQLLGRGVRVAVSEADKPLIWLGESERDEAILGLLESWRPGGGVGRAAGDRSARLLDGHDVEEIRRLHRGGLSTRRIGLIFHRTPHCIAEILAGRPDRGAANSNADGGLTGRARR